MRFSSASDSPVTKVLGFDETSAVWRLTQSTGAAFLIYKVTRIDQFAQSKGRQPSHSRSAQVIATYARNGDGRNSSGGRVLGHFADKIRRSGRQHF